MNSSTDVIVNDEIIAIVTLVFVLIGTAITIVGQWKLFEKCGEKGWKSIIPFYNDWTIIKISDCKWWFFLFIIIESIFSFIVTYNENLAQSNFLNFLSLLGIITIYIIFCVNYNIAKKFNQGTGFAVAMTLMPYIFYLILGFSDKYKYDSNIKVNSYGIYEFKKNKSDLKVEKKYCINCGTELFSNFCSKCGKNKKGD